MQEYPSPSLAPQRRKLAISQFSRAVGVSLTALALALAPLGAFQSAASAAEIDPIKSIATSPDPGSVLVGAAIPMDIAVTVPDSATTGDTFSVDFDSNVAGVSSSLDLKDDQGATIGSCVTNATRLKCTLSSYVETHVDVTAFIRITVTAKAPTGGAGLTWVTGAGAVHQTGTEILPLPSGIAQGLYKAHSISSNGSITYRIGIGGRNLTANNFQVADAYDSRVVIKKNSISARHFWKEPDGTLKDEFLPQSAISVNFDDANHGFVVSFSPDVVKNSTLDSYQLNYSAFPDDSLEDGDIVTNVATSGTERAVHNLVFTGVGGGGGGSIGSISWSKVDEAGVRLAGAAFKLAGPNGYSEVIQDNGPLDQDSRDGEFSVGSLPKGDYSLVEESAPEGYEMSDVTLTTTLASGSMTQALGGVVNRKISVPVDMGSLAWSKVDPKRNLLSGSEWLLAGPGGAETIVVDNGTNDADPRAGHLRVPDLAQGKYVLSETRAPEGFQLSKKTYPAEISANDMDIDLGGVENLPVKTTPPPVTPPSSNNGGTLAVTGGADPLPWLPIAAGTLLLGLALLASAQLAARKKSSLRS